MGVCAHLCGQEWPCLRISMAAAMAMNALIYGPCMRVSITTATAIYPHIYRPCMRISIAVVMAM